MSAAVDSASMRTRMLGALLLTALLPLGTIHPTMKGTVSVSG